MPSLQQNMQPSSDFFSQNIFGCQAQWMPETSHSQWRNWTSCLPWNYQGCAPEVGSMCDINWITVRSFCITHKWAWCCEHVSECRHAAEDILKFCSTCLLDFKFVGSTRTQRLDIAKEWIWLWRAELNELHSSLHSSLPVARLGEAALFAVAAQSQAEARGAWSVVKE